MSFARLKELLLSPRLKGGEGEGGKAKAPVELSPARTERGAATAYSSAAPSPRPLPRKRGRGIRLQANTVKGLALGLFALGAVLIAQALYIPAKAVLAQILLERAFARTLTTGVAQRPWPWADMTPEARLTVPQLGVDTIVLKGASGQAMAFGPGRMLNTKPLGSRGTTVIAAHRDTSFSFLKALLPGDVIDTETADGARYQFRVAGSRIVRADASGLDPADAGPAGARLALVTCYPFAGVLRSPWRYVVIADLLPTYTGRSHFTRFSAHQRSPLHEASRSSVGGRRPGDRAMPGA